MSYDEQDLGSQTPNNHSPPSSSLSSVLMSAGGNWGNPPLLPPASGPGPHGLLKVPPGPVAPGWTLQQVGTWTGGRSGETEHLQVQSAWPLPLAGSINVRGTSARKDKAMHTLVAPNGLRMPPNASTWTQWLINMM